MTDLHDKARALLALRDKATPGPWIYVRRDEWGHSVATQHGEIPDGSPNYWTVASINKNREPEHEANARLIAAAHDMADTIAALLAEVERLELAIKRQAAAARQLHSAERALMSADREAAEKARKMTDADALDSLREANDILTSENETLRSRSEAAESRLRELASAEPRAWVDGENFVWPKGKRRPSNCDALIRRPEMP